MKINILPTSVKTFFMLVFVSFFSVANSQALNQKINRAHSSSSMLQQSGGMSNSFKKDHNLMMVNASPLEQMRGKVEDLSKRDANAKHYKNADGSYTALIGAGPMHYQKNGRWLDIETKINKESVGNYSYSNKANLMESYFGSSSAKGIMSKTKEGEVKEFLNTKMYWEVNGQKVGEVLGSDVPAKVDGDKLYYDNLFGRISAEYTVEVGRRKLNYIIPDREALGTIPANADYLVFSEEIELGEGMRLINEFKEKNRKINSQNQSVDDIIKGVFVEGRDGNIIYAYNAPLIIEEYEKAEFSVASSEKPVISFEVNNGKIFIYTKVKASWLSVYNRKFPIAIDPTVTANPFNAQFASGQCFPTGGADGNIYAGYNGGWYRGWLTFDMKSLPSLLNVTAASVSLYVGAKVGTFSASTTTGNRIFIGKTNYDLSRLIYLNNYTNLYNAITDPVNAPGAYTSIPNVATGAYYTANLGATSTVALADIERLSGNDMSFFAMSFSPSWGTGTTNMLYGIYGYSDATRKPYLTVTYTANDKYCHSAHKWANTAAYKDAGYVGISNVTIGTINNTTSFANTPTGYNKFNLTSDVNAGDPYNLAVRYRDLGSPFNAGKVAVWVDWNEDGDFSGIDEYIGVSDNTISGNQLVNFTINVPSGTSAGVKRLRIRSALYDEIFTSADFCKTMDYGETEDYNLNVLSCKPAGVSIASNATANTICAGNSVTFTATPTNGGTAPTYQWKVNGNNVGTNSATYSATNIANGDIVTVVMTSNYTPCTTGNPATSNAITMTVNATVAPAVSISENPSTAICSGTNVTFTATPTNGGTTPSYQWKVNGSNVGTNSANYSATNLVNGDVVTVVMTTSLTSCVSSSTATSNAIKVVVNPSTTLNLSSAASTTNQEICSSSAITIITYNIANTTGVTVTGLPAGVNYDFTGGVLTISGTATVQGTFNYSVTAAGNCNSPVATGTLKISKPIDWANLQSPGSATICANSPFTAYGKVYVSGVTSAAGENGLQVQFGYSTASSNPVSGADWTWANATWNNQQINDDEYKYTFTPTAAGSYYYTFRYRTSSVCNWYYGGYHSGAGGQWDGTTNVSGVLTVDPALVAGMASSNLSSVCAGGSATLTLAGSTGNIQWQASTNGGSTFNNIGTGASISVSPSSNTIYQAVLTNACGSITSNQVTVTIDQPITYGNLQWPPNGSVCPGSAFTAYGQVYKAGVTEAAGAGAGITAEFGYSSSDTDPSSAGWTWASAIFNVQSGNNDEYKYDFVPATNGTYYYAFRYKTGNCNYIYGQHWNGSANVNGVLEAGQTTVFSSSGWSIPPTGNLSAKITSAYSTSGAGLNVCSLWVTNNAVATINAGSPIIVQNGITVDAGSNIVVENDANLIQLKDDATNSGNILVKRNAVVPSTQYMYWSTPVEFVTGQNFKTIYPNIPTALYYNEANNLFGNSSGANILGRGLAVKGPTFGGPNVTAQFLGKPFNGLAEYNLTYSGALYGHHLVGNPYPSNIDLVTLYGNNNSKIDATFQFWDNTHNEQWTQMGSGYPGDSYAKFNASSDTKTPASNNDKAPSRYAVVGQGFMVRALPGIATASDKKLVFRNSIRTTNAGVFFNRGSNLVNDGKYWLRMTTPKNNFNTIAVTYSDGATNGFERFDSKQNSAADMFYSVADDYKLAIQGRQYPFVKNDVVPLGSKQFEAGIHKIEVVETEGIFNNGQKIYLKDNQTGIITDLTVSGYSFAADVGENTGRFEIIYEAETILATGGNAKQELQVYRDGNDFVVKAQSKKITMIEVYDAGGRLIYNITPNSTKGIVDALHMNNGMYVLKIHQGGEVTTRKVLK